MIKVDLTKQIRTHDGSGLHINTQFASGQITQLVGPSGAGKTTLLKMLAGLIQPDQGRIQVDDQVWLDTEAGICLEPQKRGVGFVFQDYALFPHMTVEKHLLYGTRDEAYIKQLLQTGRLEPFRHHKPRQLSGGQQQRLAILRALSTKPRLLLMDEPFTALDNALKKELIADLKNLLTVQGTTCLVVTHQPFLNGEFAGDTFEME
ncbi:MAG: ATP-binding cassette domain-containing protein [Williamsia sp.]|nr:ATP-binding cassette domain-containing protein [Williamsia sp.]